MEVIVTNIGTLASLIGSLTVVGSALIWIYNKFIGEPRERKREREAKKRQEEMIMLITERNKPLNESIQGLLDFSEASSKDRELLHRVADEQTLKIGEHGEELKNHERRLDDHDDRILILETKNGITKVTRKD